MPGCDEPPTGVTGIHQASQEEQRQGELHGGSDSPAAEAQIDAPPLWSRSYVCPCIF